MNYLHDNPIYHTHKLDENEDSHLGRHLLKVLKKYENEINQIELVTGATETHGSVRTRSIRMAEALKFKGIKKGDIVLLCAENHNDICIPYLASFYIGAAPLGLTTNMKHIEIKHVLTTGRPSIVFSDPIAVPGIKKVLIELECYADIVTFGNEKIKDCTMFSEFVKKTGTEDAFMCDDFDPKTTMAVLMCSSGSTGLPKLVSHSHYSIYFSLYLVRKHMTEAERKESMFLTFSPMYWISGTVNVMSSCLLGYPRIQSARQFSPEDFDKACRIYKPTITLTSQLALSSVIKYVEAHGSDITNFRMIYVGGSSTSDDLIDKLIKLVPDCIISTIYGCTEIFFATGGKIYKRGSCGKSLTYSQWKIVDLETNEILGPFQQGELCVKSPCEFLGYYDNPEATNEAYDEDGWYKTGDLIYYDDEGFFYVVDRIKMLIKYRNYQVSSIEIENVINNIPGVAGTAVVGLPHYEDGEHPMAFVELMPGASVSSEEIENVVKETFSDYKHLRGGIVFIDSIPTTYSGKINRKAVNEMKKNYEVK